MRHTSFLLRLFFSVMTGLLLAVFGSNQARGEDVAKMFDEANNLVRQGKPDQALPIAEKLANGNHGLTDAGKASVYNLYGVCLMDSGNPQKAIPVFEKGEKAYESLKASEQQDFDLLLFNLAIAYKLDKKPENSIKTLEKLLLRTKKKRGNIQSWEVLQELAYLNRSRDDYGKAMPLINEAITEYKRTGDKNPVNEATLLRDRTDYLDLQGKRQEAAQSAKEWVPVARRAFKNDDERLARALQYYGQNIAGDDKTQEAHQVLSEAVQIYGNAQRAGNPVDIEQLCYTMITLAGTKSRLSQLREAEALLQQTKKIIEGMPGDQTGLTATWHHGCRVLYVIMKDKEKALHHAEQTAKLYAKAYGENHPLTNDAKRALAQQYAAAGRSDLAGELAKDVEASGGGTDMNQLQLDQIKGWELYSKRDYAGAEKVFTEFFQEATKQHGKDHPFTASALNGLVNVCCATNQLQKGVAVYARLAECMKSQGAAMDPYIARKCYISLAVMGHKLKKEQEAKLWATRWYTSYEQLLNSVLSTGTQEQRLEFAASENPYYPFAALNEARALGTMVLRLKGAVMDSLLEERRYAIMSKDPSQRTALAELARLKDEYRKLSFTGGRDNAGQLEAIRAKMDSVEQSLAGMGASSGTTRRALKVKIEDVQAKLPPGSLLIEFIRHLDQERYPCYGAVLIPPKGEPTWIPIGKAHDLDRQLRSYKFISNHFGHPRMMEEGSKSLHRVLWEPLEKHFPAGTKRLILSPDSELCFVSFATLIDPKGKFLCENYDMQYVASGRDLLRQPYKMEMEKAKDSMAIYADPSYLTGAAAKSGGPRWMSQLPGAREEGKQLKELADSWNWKTTLLIDEAADEPSLRRMPGPRILHLSTHGFYFDHMPHPGRQDQEANPMLKSGLALAGAENTFRAWQSGKAPDPSDDGILMADELGDLNLRGTWLVCLSACQTAGGEAKSGEGVMGMRRGFVEAGAQHLISTLWPIPDDTTVPFMKDFYTRLHATPDPALVLSQVQRDWLVKMRDEEKSAGLAIIKAGAFINSSYGQPGS